jgi:hypothetical protein
MEVRVLPSQQIIFLLINKFLQMEENEVNSEELLLNGEFGASIGRNTTKIRKDRGIAMAEDTEIQYRMVIQTLRTKLKRTLRTQSNMLDLGGDSILKIISPNDYDAQNFVDKDMELSLEIKKIKEQLEVAEERYVRLFGAKLGE